MTEATIHDLTGQGRSFDEQPKLQAEATKAFENLMASFPEGLAGYVLLAVNSSGEWKINWRTGAGEVLGPTMLAGLAKEAVGVEVTVDRRIRDRRKAEVPPERLAAFSAREIEQSAEDVVGIIGGTRSLAALNVGGVILAEDGALAPGVVSTAAIAANAVTEASSTYTAGSVTLTGTTPRLVQSLMRTVNGNELDVDVSFHMTVWHPSGGGIEATIRVLRDSVDITDAIEISAIGGDIIQGWQTFSVPDSPPAGTYTWEVVVTLSNNDAATQTAIARRLRVREFNR